MKATDTWESRPGFQWRAYLRCEEEEETKHPNKVTADTILGGWAPTEKEADRKAMEADK